MWRVALIWLLAIGSSAKASVIFESALPGAPGQTAGISIGGNSVPGKIYGTAFSLAQNAQVEAIGGLFFSGGGGFPDDIFGAIVELTSIDAVPVGDPFLTSEVVALT